MSAGIELALYDAEEVARAFHRLAAPIVGEEIGRIAGDSERSIYDALGVPWQEPWERG